MPSPFLVKKLAVDVVRNPEKSKKIIVYILTVIIGFILLPTILLNSVSSILKKDVVFDEKFDITTLPGYLEISTLTEVILNEIKVTMDSKAAQIREENTETEEGPDGELTEVCRVTTTVIVNPIDLGYLLAYITVKDGDLFSDDYKVDRADVKEFIHSITEIEVLQNGDDYIIQNRVYTLEQIIELCFDNETSKEFFQASYENFSDLIMMSGANQGDGLFPDTPPGLGGSGGASLSACHPRVITLANQLVSACAVKGYPIRITETVRTIERQDELYAQGRTKPGNIVTNAPGRSYSSMHQWGIAFDICRADGKGAYNESGGYFNEVGKIGKSLGLEWGGDWSSIVDKPHFQLPNWGSSASSLKRQFGNPQNFADTWR